MLQAWRAEGEENRDVGEMCLVDEMHVIEYVFYLLLITVHKFDALADTSSHRPHGWLHV